RLWGGDTYQLEARFSSVAGLNVGSRVDIAGVRVGTVRGIRLDPQQFVAIVILELPRSIELDDDTIASIRTAGLIGDRFVSLSPGGSGIPLEPGDMILDTESAMDIESLISRFAFGSIDDDN
ncbi:outer membrane lipid asymmetry maintenance protein MlaD, partial [Arthrospira platensis SPKY1]|nr:outer membrane lipid asymmetry maintenance protein MlaD [Arthrospira platensis SPKY1]